MSSRKRARTAVTTPATQAAPPKVAISGGTAYTEKFAHRIVLMAGSDFFDGVFSSGMAEAGSAQAAVTEYLQIAPLFDSVAACLEARLTPDNCRGSGVTAPVVRATASEEAVARASPVVA
ncbi:hypothetical protein EMIHUDRAFT_234519 [Emiliania huxleyi CCMP1516]|uniref:BTB domain-containing protein n=2 Tax=Emiliania huxleyi TaxID=2903 RepID=A0A0D3JZB0_EMIH1|nr:hypothetical protein EMIHUDRAFT_234519 [Emiliania huxleyi CCMP1516]EOD28845.1 hypothetical protein EMIHUDRAFT_234519 [Emiliania huxleyi CCMP1516]|eukprot:XP_005781274.1 hypothetical protein EMIHUDRAFT_234519 [Emiliania huxleyi CCMP1516]